MQVVILFHSSPLAHMQGVFIFLFYVVRNDKVWSKLTRSSQKKKKGAQTASVSVL